MREEKQKQKRSKNIIFVVTPEEHKTISDFCKEKNWYMSGFIRETVMEKISKEQR